MARDDKRVTKSRNEAECQRFKKHNQNQTKKSDEKLDHKIKPQYLATATSSNLSRNVIKTIEPEKGKIGVKRTSATEDMAEVSPMPETLLADITRKAPAVSNEEKDITRTQCFKPGPPPALNTLHRLKKKVSDVQAELNMVDLVPDKAGLKLAEEKLVSSPNTNKNFKKSVSKRVGIPPEEQLYSSLANLSLSSTSFDCGSENVQPGFWVQPESRKGRDPEPKLEWFHQPYQGTEVLIHASEDVLQMLIDESHKVQRDILLSTSSKNINE